MEKPDVEILVHITAPSKAADDAKYRALTAAYLEFKPKRWACVTGGLDATKKSGQNGKLNSVQHSSQPNEISPPSQRLRMIESPILSFQSAINNLDSPRLKHAKDQDISETQTSWEPPPSTVQDSMPNNNVTVDGFCTPSRILDFYTPPLASSQTTSSPILRRRALHLPRSAAQKARHSQHYQSPAARDPQLDSRAPASAFPHSLRDSTFTHRNSSDPGRLGRSIPEASQVAISTDQTAPEPYCQPSRRKPTDPTSSNKALVPAQRSPERNSQKIVIPQSPIYRRKRSLPTELMISDTLSDDIIEETRIESPSPSPVSFQLADDKRLPPRAESEPPIAKRPRTVADPPPVQTLPRGSSDLGPRQSEKEERRPSSYYTNKLHVVSPPPPTNKKELFPQDMITDVLARLAHELKLEKRYRPELQTRELRPFERGYWHVDCSSWNMELRRSAWVFLMDYLEKGIAGWGTSCTRDCNYTSIRLRCWGCVAGHMYLVLYVASRRQVLFTGMTWIGGDGKVVVKMGTRPPKA